MAVSPSYMSTLLVISIQQASAIHFSSSLPPLHMEQQLHEVRQQYTIHQLVVL